MSSVAKEIAQVYKESNSVYPYWMAYIFWFMVLSFYAVTRKQKNDDCWEQIKKLGRGKLKWQTK